MHRLAVGVDPRDPAEEERLGLRFAFGNDPQRLYFAVPDDEALEPRPHVPRARAKLDEVDHLTDVRLEFVGKHVGEGCDRQRH